MNVTGNELAGQKVRIYPVTRIQGRADIEVLFDPHHNVAEARFRALDYRGTDRMAVGMPAQRVPQVLSTLSVLEMRHLIRRLSGTTVLRP